MSSPSAFRRIAATVLALYAVAMLAGTVAHDEALPNAGCSANGEPAWIELCDTDCPRDHEHHRHPSSDHRHDCLVCRGLLAAAPCAEIASFPGGLELLDRVAVESGRVTTSLRYSHPPSRGPPAAF